MTFIGDSPGLESFLFYVFAFDLISSCRSFVGFEAPLTFFLQVSQILMVPQHYFCFFLGWWFRVDPPLWRGRGLRVQSRRSPTRTGSSPQPGIRGANPPLIINCFRTANSKFSYTTEQWCLFVSFLYNYITKSKSTSVSRKTTFFSSRVKWWTCSKGWMPSSTRLINKVYSVLFYYSCIAFELRYFQTASYLTSSLSQNKWPLTKIS